MTANHADGYHSQRCLRCDHGRADMSGVLFGVVLSLFFAVGVYLAVTNGSGVCQP